MNSRVLEIGAIRVEDGEVTRTYKELLSPEMPVPWYITKLTGITNEMVWDSPSFTAIAHELELLLSDAIFIAHNVSFDYSFIKMEFEKLNRNFNMDRLCTVKLSRSLYPKQIKHSLDAIIKAHDIKVASRHRALDDAKVLYDFFNIAFAEHGLKAFAAMNRNLTKARLAAS